MKISNSLPTNLLLWLCLALTNAPAALAQRKLNGSRSAKPSPVIVVGPNVQVSKAFASRAHNETHVAANPRNPLNLLGGSMVWLEEANTQTVVAYASFDGGKTWSVSLKFDDGLYHSDPAAGFDAEGNAYFLQITNTGGREPKLYTHLYRSKDGGRSWLEPIIMPMVDRNYVAVDDGPGKYYGSLYLNGARSRVIRVLRSRDRGASFVGEVQAAAAPSGRLNTGLAPLVILSDGTLVVSFMDTDVVLDPDREGSPTKQNTVIKVVTSTDGGETFSEPVTIAPNAFGHDVTSNAQHFSLAVDRSEGPFKDRLYVTWPDSFSRGGQTSAKKSGGSNILLSYSTNKGKSWSKPIVLNDDHPPVNWADAPVHFQPVVAVNKYGVVGVMYYDRRDSSNNLDWTTRFTASLDGGETFLPSVQVAESPNRYGNSSKIIITARGFGGGHWPPNTNYGGGALKFDVKISQFNLGGGHTVGLDADANGVFHPFWVDNRTGVAQVWTAPVTVHRKAVSNGDSELATLEDVSEKVMLVYKNPTYDARTGRVTIDVQVQNMSEDTIVLPAKLRVIDLTTANGGIPTIIGADNGVDGVGAVWDLDKVFLNQKLKPNEKSSMRRLEFRLVRMPPLSEALIRSRGRGVLELVHVEARLLANVQRNAPTSQK